LDNTDSLIANYIYQDFLKTDIRLSATGAKKVNPENATNQTPAYLIAASQNFIKQYQGNIYKSLLYGNFIDYYGCNDIEKPLWLFDG
jgi:hypothetical protein